MRSHKLAIAVIAGIAALGLSACAATLPTTVSRYQVMPVPAGQTFYVVPGEGVQGGLEFGHYAALAARQLEAKGYHPAGTPQQADMLVKLSYAVDEGRVERSIDPLARSRYAHPSYRGFYDPWGRFYGRPYWSRFGYYGGHRSPFFYGWDDPFWYSSPYAGYGRGFRDPVREYTVYEAELGMNIVRRVDNQPLFEGKAQARAQTDELGVLVPNLIEAMFTGFPGRSGETVKITVPARKRS